MSVTAELAAQDANLRKQQGAAQTGLTQATQQQEQTLAAKDAAVAPLQDKLAQGNQQLEQLADQPPPASEAAAMKPPEHKIDPQDFSAFQALLLGVGLIGGIASKGNWLGASAVLNGAMKGYLKGDQDAAARQYEEFEQKFKAAQAHDEERNKEYAQVRDNRKLSLSAQMEQYRMIAAKYDDQATLAAARMKSYDQVLKQIDSRLNSNEQMRIRHEEFSEKMKAALGGAGDGKSTAVRAAMADRGISFPTGMRSDKAQNQTIAGLLAAHPDDTPAQIADRIARGEIEFKAQTKETQTAAAIVGKTAVGENEILEFAPKALAASANVPRGSFVPMNELLQKGLENVSDPDLKRLASWTNTILNAYDVVAARGGTDKEKRAENRKNLLTADSAETYAVALSVITEEAEGAKKAAVKATHVPEFGGEEPSGSGGSAISLQEYLDRQTADKAGQH